MAFLIDHIGRVAGPLTVAATVALLALPAHAGDDSEALGEVEVPLPGNLDEFVDDTDAAVRLGKALFWDTQVGGDGQTACATCHFKAGVDARVINTVNPGPDGLFTIVTGPGETVDAADFPFGSLIIEDDIIGSQGVVRADFVDIGYPSRIPYIWFPRLR